jgi:predicted MPP superfamily phosphohydrolase
MTFFCILSLACFGHGFFWVGWVNRFHAWAGPRWIIDFITLLCVLGFVGIPLLLAYSWFLSGLAYHPVNLTVSGNASNSSWQLSIWLSIYLNLCALGGGGKILWRLLGPHQADQPKTLRDIDKKMLNLEKRSPRPLPVGLSTQWMCMVPINQVLNLSVEKKRIAVPQLTKAHEGLTIAHISDLHMTGRIDRDFFRLVAEEVNALEPDIIVLTGDIIENDACRPWLADSLGRMQSRFGKFFILGNHDLFVDSTQTRGMLTEMGWIDFGSRSQLVALHGSPVLVAGNELPWFSPAADLPIDEPAGSAKSEKANGNPGQLQAADHSENADLSDNVNLSEKGPLRILLAHSPDQFPWCCQRNIDLVLAGHTHGGQICLPLLGPVACPCIYGTRYAQGVFQQGNTVMHVTRGISGETPFRWNCPPELALLELVRS